MMTPQEAKQWEEHASRYLAEKGYKIVKRNFRFGNVGEIDIVCYDDEMLVFVEVKARNNYAYGTPEESITPRKQSQLKKVAKMYYSVNRLEDVPCRFDVVAIDHLFGKTEVRHHMAAFY
jgi:putative endonuclease